MVLKDLHQLEKYFQDSGAFDLLGVNKIGVFGSFARNEFFNDIDLLIEDEVSTEALIAFQANLQKDIDMPVDVAISKYTEPIILFRAKQDIKYACR